MSSTRTARLIDYPPHRPYSLGTIACKAAKGVGSQLEQWLNPSYDPTIVRRSNQYNIPYWEVYNPATKRTVYCASEAEVDQWLEQILG